MCMVLCWVESFFSRADWDLLVFSPQNILQISENGSMWSLAPTNYSGSVAQPGALSCGNAPQIVSSATFGPFCSAIQTQATCTAQCGPIACRCTWLNSHCTPPPPPAPPPPAPPAPPKPPQHGYTVGEAKFYGTNLLCELDAPNGESFHKQISANISLLQLLYFVGSMQ